MSNLNKTYHKGKYRGYEYGKSIGTYLKRLGNKKFRKSRLGFNDENQGLQKYKKKATRKRIKAKITIKYFGNHKISYYKKYRTIRDLNNAVNRPNVIRCYIIE